MKKIAAALITSFTLLAQIALAAPPAVPTESVASLPAPMVVTCYIAVSQQTLDEDKTCGVYKVSECSKNHRTCKWMAREGYCRGLMSSFCVGLTPHQCKNGIELVTKIPKVTTKESAKYQCLEKTPVKLKKL